MDNEGTRNFHLSRRSLAVILSLTSLLVMSVFWNVHQRRLIALERERLLAIQSKETARANRGSRAGGSA